METVSSSRAPAFRGAFFLLSVRALPFLLSLLLTVGACRDTKSTAVSPPVAPPPAPAVIRFERTPCMGECPAFVAEISADGALRYTGRRFSPKEGEVTSRLSADAVATIRATARAMQFATLPEDAYGHGMMDAPAAILTIDGHTVKCTGGECPEELKSLHRYLDRELKTALGIAGEQ
ncbi:MAG: hypothetical protein H7330_07510 [Hymenobacteraceae bacterium]|nr:hypothetical protein [Hymenobacteraceae bacterium]